MRPILISIIATAFCVAGTLLCAAQPRTLVKIDSSAALLVSPDEPEPVRHAAEDLNADFEKTIGRRLRIITRESDAAPVTIVIGQREKLPQDLSVSNSAGRESFSLSTRIVNRGGHPFHAVVLTGADLRGTMYAIYQFSEKYLGVDPMYYWTDHEPVRRASIEVPDSLNQAFPSPVFRYRGLFINDEDLLTGWSPAQAKDRTGISLDVWNKIYETILRLKGNMVAPGTWIFPDDAQVKLAARRGLILTQHHAIPLGLNVARWPQDTPYNYTTHPEILQRAWRNAVREYLPDQEVLWSVGLRGLSDVTYASMDAGVRDDNKALGRLIGKAIADQIGIVREGRPQAEFVTNLWQEGARLRQQGNLSIPAEVTTVWADDGYGYLQDNGNVMAGQGAYDHVAMMNFRANQLTEMIPVDRSFSEMERYIKAGATSYFLVNTSDIRPVVMSTRAVMDVAWQGLPKAPDPAGRFYREWSTGEFGGTVAARLTNIYRKYFAAPALGGSPSREYGDQLYHTEARQMLLTYMTDAPLYSIPGQAPKWASPRVLLPGPASSSRPAGKAWLQGMIAREIRQCSDAQPRWESVWNEAASLEPLIPAPRRHFYEAQVLAMIAINRESNRMLLSVSQAIEDAEAEKNQDALREVSRALASFREIDRAEAAAEYGKWKNWYRGDWLTGVYRTREIVQTFAKFLGDPETHMSPPLLWDDWEAYYHIMRYEGDRSVNVHE